MRVRRETFQTADGDRLEFLAEDAFRLALAFLRANTAANRRERAGFLDGTGRAGEIAVIDQRDEFRNIHVHRAAGHAHRFRAVQAAGRLVTGFFFGVTKRDFLEIMRADLRVLLTHRSTCGLNF